MTREEGREVILSIVNSGIIDFDLEVCLTQLANCICDDSFEPCRCESRCEDCKFLRDKEKTE